MDESLLQLLLNDSYRAPHGMHFTMVSVHSVVAMALLAYFP